MESTTRRRFIQGAALGTAGLATPALAQESPRTPRTQAEVLAELARLRFGQHLNEAQMKSVQQRLGRAQATSEHLKRTPLTNADEPAFVFLPED